MKKIPSKYPWDWLEWNDSSDHCGHMSTVGGCHVCTRMFLMELYSFSTCAGSIGQERKWWGVLHSFLVPTKENRKGEFSLRKS